MVPRVAPLLRTMQTSAGGQMVVIRDYEEGSGSVPLGAYPLCFG